ncbi:hypothetical protein [Nocardia callitridis]|uniref:hypothetical protein n=1 Tax=Nocardia callitridis TaxID=648753 RepID=UPI0031F021D1
MAADDPTATLAALSDVLARVRSATTDWVDALCNGVVSTRAVAEQRSQLTALLETVPRSRRANRPRRVVRPRTG